MFSNDELSDEEIFYGKISLKEVKKKIFINQNRKTISSDVPQPVKSDQNESLKIIEVHSEPEVISQRDNEFGLENELNEKFNSNPDISIRQSFSCWDVKSSEDSFLKLEKLVSNLCMSPKKEELDNTLEIVDHILSNPEGNNSATKKVINKSNLDENHVPDPDLTVLKSTEIKKEIIPVVKSEFFYLNNEKHTSFEVPDNPNPALCKEETKPTINKTNEFVTPHKPIFKTPSTFKAKKYVDTNKNTPLSSQKYKVTTNQTPNHNIPMSIKKTPLKSNAYEHIKSPIASYIRQSPQVPLLKDVFPKKPLPGTSNIPKAIKSNVDSKSTNKENIMLPPVAYRSAKKTQVINVPDKGKMPQSPWAKQLTTSLPKPVVMKHDHRESNKLVKLVPSSQDSFADLSLHQADLSVCTQKSAINKI